MTQMTTFSFGARLAAPIDEVRPVAAEARDRLTRAIAGSEVPA